MQFTIMSLYVNKLSSKIPIFNVKSYFKHGLILVNKKSRESFVYSIFPTFLGFLGFAAWHRLKAYRRMRKMILRLQVKSRDSKALIGKVRLG